MIQSFGSKATEDLCHGFNTREARKVPQNIWKVACRKLDMIHTASELKDLSSPPSNRLELLKGNLKRKYSIRINRITFEFDGNAHDVTIEDYY